MWCFTPISPFDNILCYLMFYPFQKVFTAILKIHCLIYTWSVTFHSLLVTGCKITRYSLQNSLVTGCRICSLQKVTCYSLLVVEVARCKKSLVTRCKIRSLLVAECARCKKITRYSLQNLFHYSLQKLLFAKICCL